MFPGCPEFLKPAIAGEKVAAAVFGTFEGYFERKAIGKEVPKKAPSKQAPLTLVARLDLCPRGKKTSEHLGQ